MSRNTSSSLSARHAAIIAGVGYLAIFIVTTFANSFALEKVIIAGDAATTAANVMASATLFRLGIAGWIVVLMCDAVVAWALYLFFKPVQEELALLAAWMRLLFVVIFAAGLLHLFPILEILSGAENLADQPGDQERETLEELCEVEPGPCRLACLVRAKGPVEVEIL